MTRQPESDPPKRRLGSFKEGCALGKFGRTKAYELIEAGKIDAYKDGSRTKIDLNSVDRYQESLPKISPRA
jgi:excisionase family DNA binding protein